MHNHRWEYICSSFSFFLLKCNFQNNGPLHTYDVGSCRLLEVVPFQFYYSFSIICRIFSSVFVIRYESIHFVRPSTSLPLNLSLLLQYCIMHFLRVCNVYDTYHLSYYTSCCRLKTYFLSFTPYVFSQNHIDYCAPLCNHI